MTRIPRVSRPSASRVVEDYVTLIWKAYEWPGGQPSTSDLAEQLGVTASTVSANLKKLALDEFINYQPYGSIELTEKGRAVAVEVVRRHRILETYLHQQLGLSWDQVHEEADQLEHTASDLLLERMNAVLGYPSHDPHGDPIPDIDGRIPERGRSQLLAEAAVGAEMDVVRVSDRSPEILRYLQEHGVVLGARLRITALNQAAGSMAVTINDQEIELSQRAAAAVRVSPRS